MEGKLNLTQTRPTAMPADQRSQLVGLHNFSGEMGMGFKTHWERMAKSSPLLLDNSSMQMALSSDYGHQQWIRQHFCLIFRACKAESDIVISRRSLESWIYIGLEIVEISDIK
jgi:hypothetical protein